MVSIPVHGAVAFVLKNRPWSAYIGLILISCESVPKTVVALQLCDLTTETLRHATAVYSVRQGIGAWDKCCALQL